MAPLPTIPNCIRVGLPWSTHLGVRPYNVFHIITASGDLSQIGLDLGTAFDAGGSGMFASLCDAFSTNTVDLTDLGTDDAGVTVPLGTTIAGGTGGQMIPAACHTVSLYTLTRGPKGRGRLYIGPVSEGAVSDGIFGDSLTMQDAWGDFMDALADTPSAASLAVASYKHVEVTGVTSLIVQNVASTQRRRQSQLR